MCILQDRVIDKLLKKKKTQPIATRLFVVIRYDIFHKTFEAISYCHKVICCNKEVIASTCLLQYLGFIAMRFFCCKTYCLGVSYDLQQLFLSLQ